MDRSLRFVRMLRASSACALLLAACGPGTSGTDAAVDSGDVTRVDGARPDTSAMDVIGTDVTTTDDASADGSTGACEAFGHFPAATNTFTIPHPTDGDGAYFPDVQTAFASVDWSTLDRLYIPAGRYAFINLGNLPRRTADRPLIITNLGGQVHIEPPAGSSQGYIWAINGGSNWILTGRYDETSHTGDAAFPGHRCGDYSNTRGRYGFLSDDHFISGGHMGLGVGDASDFEIEFVEVTRAGFAGVRILNRPATDGSIREMANVRFHDNYVHDTKSEGLYFGWTGTPPSALLRHLQVWNNRIIRTGTETAQLQNLGEGSEVHHNVFAFGAIDWRAAFAAFQDNASQTQVRQGTISFHHNVIMGGAASLVNYFAGPETGDTGLDVTYADNYFADTLSLGIYLGGTAPAGSRFAFARNVFRGLDFGYNSLDPAATDPAVVLRVGGMIAGDVPFDANTWEGSRRIAGGITGGTGTSGRVMATNNTNAAVPAIEFVNNGLPPGTPTRRLEMWASHATLAGGMPAVTYDVGSFVMDDGELYECIAMNTDQQPATHPQSWRHLPQPVDDFRTVSGSPYAALGLMH